MSFGFNAKRMDPRAELILMIFVNIIAFTYDTLWAELTAISLLLILQIVCGCRRSAFKWLVIFGILVSVQYLLIPYMPKILAVLLTIFTVFARKIFPCIIAGSLIIQTTPVRYIILALRKWHIPQGIIIPFAVTMRYFPAIKEEYRYIRDAMKLKNIKGFGKKAECTMLPILVSAIQTSDELSAAAITRGIENPCKKTSIIDMRFRLLDWISITAAAIMSAVTVFIA